MNRIFNLLLDGALTAPDRAGFFYHRAQLLSSDLVFQTSTEFTPFANPETQSNRSARDPTLNNPLREQSSMRNKYPSPSLPGTCSIFLCATALVSSVCALQQPFQPVETARALVKRQGGCIPNYYSCANQGAVFGDTCCQNGQSCKDISAWLPVFSRYHILTTWTQAALMRTTTQRAAQASKSRYNPSLI